MELLQKMVSCGMRGKKLITQLTFDDDINVSDQNADIRAIIMQTGHVRLEEMRVLGNKIRLTGHLEFSVLYSSEDQGALSCIKGDFAFEEMVNYEGGQEGDLVTVLWEMEDLRAQMIHSRKMNVKAVVTFSLYPARMADVWAAVGVQEPTETEILTRTEQFAGLKLCGKDTIRVREVFSLPGGSPDAERIIFQDSCLCNVKTRSENGRLSFEGELSVFLLYRCADEHMPLQWVERQLPIKGEVEAAQSADLMLSASCVQLAHTELSIQEDEDGEMREIAVEAVLQCDLMLFAEQQIELLEDVYVPEMEFSITKPEIWMTTLEGSNDSRMKMNVTMPLHAQKPLIQVIHTRADVKVEEYYPGDGGLVLEGIISIDLLYQQADPENPFDARHQDYPFTYTVQMPAEGLENGLENGLQLQITSLAEQVHAALSGADEAEIRLLAGFCILSCKERKFRAITQIEMHPVSPEKIEDLPGITGYMVKPQDTLWSIARKFYVPLSSIREVNSLASDELKPGQKLLIVK